MKNFGEKGAWAYPETAQIFLVPPIISGTGKATNFNFGGYFQSVHASKSPLKIGQKRERGRIKRLPQFFEFPIISGTGKATNFQFCTDVLSIHQNKAHYKFQEK